MSQNNLTLSELKQQYSNCNLCQELCDNRIQVVFGSGKENSTVIFIGEASGASEDKQGIPFCGASGKVLQDLLATIGLTRGDVFITNTVICRPPNNRNPKKEEIENCRDRLDKTIQIIQPKVIVTVGNFATQRITGKIGITKLRGNILEVTFNSQIYKVVPVVHPASLLYNGRNSVIFDQMKKDFQTIKKVIEESII
ncbi:uracil-DNA glycosylase [archaeon]|jgi:uracil-DNA glycosylase|nr:uracil-DNA glycosylase [archaeon]MBT3451639.1 uracil-DNA glycosylase [archaeon]MBT6869660.1 uracil-DNA glycosylase [archaeon]MBT7192428.1 uracil-DNA glycosylase [archaeon]MBT7380229.1 uracil-DNA glycosylase [archaeon]